MSPHRTAEVPSQPAAPARLVLGVGRFGTQHAFQCLWLNTTAYAVRRHVMKEFLATLAIIAIIAGVGFYAAGWLTVQQADNETTIEVRTGDIKRAADETAETV